MGHAIAQLVNRAAAFFLTHEVQPLDALFQRTDNFLLQSGRRIAVFRSIHSAWKFQHGVEVGLSADAKLFGHLAEGAQVSADQLAVDSESCASCALHADGDFEVAAVQALFQKAADLDFYRVKLGGHAEMEIEKTVVDRLQAQAECELIAHVGFDLRVPGHRADVHGETYSVPEAVSISSNCK